MNEAAMTDSNGTAASARKLRVGVLGVGWWSDVLADAAKRSGAIEIAACYTRSEDKRRAFAAKYGCRAAASYEEILADAQARLADAQDTLPRLDGERRAAQEKVQFESAQIHQLEARLAALKQLQENVQTEGKIQPWLDKHELGSLPRLWKKLHVEAGWETALEAVLRERRV